jgi:hypothetical protein
LESKVIIPIIIILDLIISAVILIASNLVLNLNIQSIFTISEIFLIGIFSTWGLLWFQKSSRGEFIYIWFIGLILLLAFGFFYDIFIAVINIWTRILSLSAIAVATGFVSYIYKIIKLDTLKIKNVRVTLFLIIIISIIISISEISYFAELFSFEKKEIKTIQNFSNYNSRKKTIISEFGEWYAFIYYDYPYQNASEDFYSLDLHYFLVVNETLLKPKYHLDKENHNILKILKKKYQTGTYILLTNYYFQYGSLSFYDGLTDEEVNQYYNLLYLNRICSSRDLNGNEKPMYWVI